MANYLWVVCHVGFFIGLRWKRGRTKTRLGRSLYAERVDPGGIEPTTSGLNHELQGVPDQGSQSILGFSRPFLYQIGQSFFKKILLKSSSTRIQKKNFEKSFLRPQKIKNKKKFVKITMLVTLYFSKSCFSGVFTGVYVIFIKEFKDAKKLVSTGGSNLRPLGFVRVEYTVGR